MKKISNNNRRIRNPNFPSHLAIAVVTCLFLVAVMYWNRELFKGEFHEGDIALLTIYAPYDFSIKGELDTIATEKAKLVARDSVPPSYMFDSEIKRASLKKAESIINSLKNIQDITEEEKASQVKQIAASYNISSDLLIGILGLKNIPLFLDELKLIIEQFMARYIISPSEADSFKKNGIKIINVVDKLTGSESVKVIDECVIPDDLKKEIKLFTAPLIKDRKERELVLNFIDEILTINLSYSNELTESKKELVAKSVPPIYNIIEIKKNEMIVNKGERIGKEHILKLKGMGHPEPSLMRLGGVFALVILVSLFILLTYFYIKFFEPTLLLGNKELCLLSIICILILSTAKLIVMSPWSSTLIPVAVGSMLIAILLNSRLAVIITCFLSILVGMVSGNRLDITGMSLIAGVVGIFAIRGARRRSQLIEAGLCVGFANMGYLIGMGLIRNLDFNTYIMESILGFGNGLASAVIVTGVLPIFENGFKISTDISLLELADLNHPLLKEMVIKAPGTYHHSLVVGNLAEAACEVIGANSLLARVGSYFHDIGKIEKASYFSENQAIGESAHDKLLPTMSSLIITNHVKNGVELAQKYRMNKTIIDIIREHHGTGLVFYFFKRALENGHDEQIEEQSFRYPGPKPQTREAACVLLADSVEAASRALDDPTASRIKGLVRKVINNKFIDGQLDECDLTLKNLEKIAEVFTHILTGIFHTRVEYPEEPEKSA